MSIYGQPEGVGLGPWLIGRGRLPTFLDHQMLAQPEDHDGLISSIKQALASRFLPFPPALAGSFLGGERRPPDAAGGRDFPGVDR